MGKEVIILAGGLGTRLRDVVKDVPKCMAPVAGKPFLWYLLKYLARFDVRKVVLSTGYLHEIIKEWVALNWKYFPFEIHIVREPEPLGTGGALKFVLQRGCQTDVILINGDTFFDVDLDELYEAHRLYPSSITMALKPMANFDRYGNVKIDSVNNQILRFEEKQPCAKGLINGGVYAINTCEPLFEGLADKFSYEREVLTRQCELGKLYGVKQNGYFIDIGIPSDYERAQGELPKVVPTLADIRESDCYTLLLDRDGVINRLLPRDYVKGWEEFEFIPGVLEAMPELSKRFKHIFIVTNQRGVGKGVMTDKDLQDIHKRMCQEIWSYGGRIDRIYCCTAVSDSDQRRKPNTGMFEEILHDYPDVIPSRCLMVGDSKSDLQFAKNCGMKFQWI